MIATNVFLIQIIKFIEIMVAIMVFLIIEKTQQKLLEIEELTKLVMRNIQEDIIEQLIL